MADCPRCGEPLSESRYIQNETYKSCPNCSRVIGRHAYYRIEYFGERHHDDGSPFIQSYCPICRGHSDRIGNPQLLCP